jgi:hypothetical protein
VTPPVGQITDDLAVASARVARSAQLLGVRLLMPLADRPELAALVDIGIRAEVLTRRVAGAGRGSVAAVWDLARRSEVARLREQLRALEHRVGVLDARVRTDRR